MPQMTQKRFNELLHGALSHPLVGFSLTRLSLALWYVVAMTGETGAAALEDWCKDREEEDRTERD